MLDVDLEVVLEVLADPGQVLDDVDAERPQLIGGADARQLQELRRVDRPAAEHDLAGLSPPRPSPRARELDTDGAVAVEPDAGDERERLDLEVGPGHHRMICAGRRQAPAVVNVAVEGGEPLLPVAVDVGGQRVAGLLHGGEEGVEQGPRAGPRSRIRGPSWPRNGSSGAAARQFSIRLKYGRQFA